MIRVAGNRAFDRLGRALPTAPDCGLDPLPGVRIARIPITAHRWLDLSPVAAAITLFAAQTPPIPISRLEFVETERTVVLAVMHAEVVALLAPLVVTCGTCAEPGAAHRGRDVHLALALQLIDAVRLRARVVMLPPLAAPQFSAPLDVDCAALAHDFSSFLRAGVFGAHSHQRTASAHRFRIDVGLVLRDSDLGEAADKAACHRTYAGARQRCGQRTRSDDG